MNKRMESVNGIYWVLKDIYRFQSKCRTDLTSAPTAVFQLPSTIYQASAVNFDISVNPALDGPLSAIKTTLKRAVRIYMGNKSTGDKEEYISQLVNISVGSF